MMRTRLWNPPPVGADRRVRALSHTRHTPQAHAWPCSGCILQTPCAAADAARGSACKLWRAAEPVQPTCPEAGKGVGCCGGVLARDALQGAQGLRLTIRCSRLQGTPPLRRSRAAGCRGQAAAPDKEAGQLQSGICGAPARASQCTARPGRSAALRAAAVGRALRSTRTWSIRLASPACISSACSLVWRSDHERRGVPAMPPEATPDGQLLLAAVLTGFRDFGHPRSERLLTARGARCWPHQPCRRRTPVLRAAWPRSCQLFPPAHASTSRDCCGRQLQSRARLARSGADSPVCACEALLCSAFQSESMDHWRC